MEPIVIVGGGIVGVGIAHALREAGARVRLIEKNALGSGTTATSIAMFLPLETSPTAFDQRLRDLAWAEYESLIERNVVGVERTGSLYCASTAEYLGELEAATETLREFGREVDLLEPSELREFGIDPQGLEGAMYTPRSGYLDPTEVIQHWSDEATASGVEIETGVEVTDVHVEDGAVAGVETTEGEFEARTVIDAAGPWSHSVAEMAGVSIPVRHTLGRILVLGTGEELSLPFTLFEDGTYFREEGRTQAFAGRLETTYADVTQLDPDAVHAVDPEFRLAVARATSRNLPALADADVVNEWVGLRTVTPDAHSLLGPTDVDGYLLATGMSGEGVMLAPVVASALADYVRTGSNEIVKRLSVDRFD